MDYVNIGSAPVDEDCAQVGQPDYSEKAREECKRFISLIREKLGPEPEGAQLKIKSFPHDFGNYLEVVCTYQDGNEAAFDYAISCENEAPETWEG